MAIEVEFHGLTGMVGPGANDNIILRHAPSTGLGPFTGVLGYDIALDPIDGPAQRLGVDFGVTHMDHNSGGNTGLIVFNMDQSDVKDVMNNRSHGITGMLTLRVLYNYET